MKKPVHKISFYFHCSPHQVYLYNGKRIGYGLKVCSIRMAKALTKKIVAENNDYPGCCVVMRINDRPAKIVVDARIKLPWMTKKPHYFGMGSLV
jgi:hypothetical protein